MRKLLLKNGTVINSDGVHKKDILISGNSFEKISENIPVSDNYELIDVENLYIFPGIIDTHVHFREPGLTHKATIETESKAAIAGGITSVIDMPNTLPFADNLEKIQQKKYIAQQTSYVNIGFFVGATANNLSELINFPKNEVAGIKLFLGKSTGNVSVNKIEYLQELFQYSYLPIVVHAENEDLIEKKIKEYKATYGKNIPFKYHCFIRSKEACLEATKMLIELAGKYNTSLHILHISTFEELELLQNFLNSNITAETCCHYLWFSNDDYEKYNGFLKCNPSIKFNTDKEKLRKFLSTDLIFSIASDHAPHTIEEKLKPYFECPSGLANIQHSFLSVLELYHLGFISLTDIAKKMAYNPAMKFKIKKRGRIKEGYYADLAVVDLNSKTFVEKDNIFSKCKWTVFKDFTFNSKIKYTILNGKIVYENGNIIENKNSMLLDYEQ